MTVDAALAELSRCAGTQFDPKVVEAFRAEIGATQRASG
jgi:response regulator RpfG family c-di-GMP phosphodiesterase